MPTYISNWEGIREAVMRKLGDVQERVKRANEALPTRRLKPVICPVTGELTDHRAGLSHRAWELIEKGLQYEADREKFDGEIQPAYAAPSWCTRCEHQLGRPFTEDLHADLLELAAALTNQHVGRRYISAPDSLMVERLETIPKPHDRLNTIRLTSQQAEALRSFGKALEGWLEEVQQAQFSKGSALLVRMAQGDIGIDELNQMAARREAP